MRKSVFSPQYEVFRRKLIALRLEAGITQRELAKRLKREHSLVAKIEQGERRLDVIEFCWVCEALKVDPVNSFADIYTGIKVGTNDTMLLLQKKLNKRTKGTA